MIGLLGSSITRAVGGQLAKGAAKKAFGGKNKKQSQIVKSPTQGQGQGKGGAIAIRPKSVLIPASTIPARNNKTVSGSSKSGPGTLERIDKEVLEIRNLLGKSIKIEKQDATTKKKLFEKELRQSKENKLEKKSKIGSGLGGPGLSKILPSGGIIDAIQNFIFSVIGGKILIFLFENRETVFNIVKGLAAATEFILDLGGKILNGIISLVDGAYDISDAISKEIEAVGGEDAEKEYGKFTEKFNKFVNIAMILAMSGVPLGGMGSPAAKPGAKPGVQPQSNLSPGGKPGAGSNKFGSGTNKTAEYMNRNRTAKYFERKYGNNAAREFTNAHNNAINSGMKPKDALADAKTRTERLIRKNKSRFKVQSAGPGLRGGPGGQVASGRAGGVFRRGLTRTGSRLQTRIMGRNARLGLNRTGARLASRVSRISSGPLGRIPIIGPLMVGIASYMEDADGDGQPDRNLSKALFKAGGSAIGGFLGSFIPIPFLGTLIGTLAGEYVGDLMYTLLKGGGISEVGKRLKNDILKVVNGAKLFSEWMMKGITNIQKQEGPELDLSWVPFSDFGKIRLGGWATLLNPLEMNLLKKFNVLRKSFFSESNSTPDSTTTYIDDGSNDGRGNSDIEGSERRSGGGARPSVTGGNGRRSIPSGNGSITKVPFGDPNFSPGKTRNKTTQIYLHWTGGTYQDTSASYGYHTIFSGDGSIHRNKGYDVTGMHTEGKNGNSVGLSLAAMGGEGVDWDRYGSYPVTQEQLNAMTAEAARLALKWGWSEGDIDKNIWTHAEAGSGLDPRGLSGHLDKNGDGAPDNYGPRMWGGSVARWDLLNVTEGAEMGSGGSVARDMVKKHFRNFKQEESKRGKSDAEGLEAAAPSGAGDRKIPNSSGLEKWLNNTERGSGEEYNLKGVGNYVRGTMFGGAPYDKLFLYPGAKEFTDKNGQVKGITRIRSYLERNYPNLLSDKIMDEKGRTKKGAGLPGNQSLSLKERKAALDAKQEVKTTTKTTTTTTERENDERRTRSSDLDGINFSDLRGTSAFTDIFSGARSNLSSIGPSSTIMRPEELNRDIALRDQASYEQDGSRTIVVNQPYIIATGNRDEQQLASSSGSKFYS